MAKTFGATSTTDEVLSGINLKRKRILVTGASAGLGVETARSLAAHGAQAVGAARDLAKAEAATAQLRREATSNSGRFELVALDLGDLKSMRHCADALLAKGEPFDVVIANAGVMATPFRHTADGFEMQFGTNVTVSIAYPAPQSFPKALSSFAVELVVKQSPCFDQNVIRGHQCFTGFENRF